MRGDDFTEITKPHHLVMAHLSETAHHQLKIASASPTLHPMLVGALDGQRYLGIKTLRNVQARDHQTQSDVRGLGGHLHLSLIHI